MVPNAETEVDSICCMCRWVGGELRAFYEDRLRMDFAELYRMLKLTNVRQARMRRWLGLAQEHAWRTWRDEAQSSCKMLGRAMYAERRDKIHEKWRGYSSGLTTCYVYSRWILGGTSVSRFNEKSYNIRPQRVVWMAKRREEDKSYHIHLGELPKETKQSRLYPQVGG